MPPRPYVLSDATWDEIRATSFTVAILPWGATEAHNHHLPYGTDIVEAESVAIRGAAAAWERGARVLVLPTIPFGVQTGQREIPFCLNMNPSTQQAVLRDLLPSLEQHGIRALVILNGHGGNDFRQIIRELQPTTGMLLCQANWYSAVKPAPFFDEPGDHAGELETSVMQHLAPDLVRPLSTAGPGTAHPFRISALRNGSAWTPRHWIKTTDDTGVGDPRAATPEKGERFTRAVVEWLSDFLVELAESGTGTLYETGG
jgi:creatinine amidohydrolase